MKEDKITEEQVSKTVKEFFNTIEPNQRAIVGKRGCVKRGWVNISDFSHCGDDECPSCNAMSKALKEEIESLK